MGEKFMDDIQAQFRPREEELEEEHRPNDIDMQFRPREEEVVSIEKQTMMDIERVGMSSALRMLANLQELRSKGLEPSNEVLESLAMLRHQIDTYLAKQEL